MGQQLTEKQKNALYQANIRLTILYMFPDICETLMADILDYRKEAGYPGFKFEQKKYWNALYKDMYNLRKIMKNAPDNIQESYGNVCEVLHDLILKAIDKCDENGLPTMLRFLEYIDSFPSKRNIEFKY